MSLLFALISGLIIGALARLIYPGKQHLTVFGTLLVGVLGSFLGGLLSLMLGAGWGGGIITGVIGALILLWIIEWASRIDAREDEQWQHDSVYADPKEEDRD